MVINIKGRDGRGIHFSPERVTRAIFLAVSRIAQEEGSKADYEAAEILTEKIINLLNNTYQGTAPTAKNVQDAVIKVLVEAGHARTSETCILYRAEHTRIRGIKTGLMKSIGGIMLADSNDADIKRENTNTNGNTAVDTMLQYRSAVPKEFYVNQLMNSQHAALHENGDIHIHDMDFINMGALTYCQIGLEELFNGGFPTDHGYLREPQDITSYAALTAVAIQSNQNDQHGGQSIPAFDFYLAKGITKIFRKEYISSLNKALGLFINLDADMREPLKTVEKGTGKTTAIIMDDGFLDSLSAMLKEILGLGEEQIKLINKFTYKEVNVVTRRRTYQAMEAFVHNLNTMHLRAGAQVPFSSINFGTDMTPEGRLISENLMLTQEAGLGSGEIPIFPILIFKVKEGINYSPEDPSYDLLKLVMRISIKRPFPNFSFMDAPFNKRYYKGGHPETEATYMGCRTRVMGSINGPKVTAGREDDSFTSINLPRLGIKHGVAVNGNFNEAAFLNKLDKKMGIAIQQLLERLEIQGRKKVKSLLFLMGQDVWVGNENLSQEDMLEEAIKQETLTIGFVGLAEYSKALIGEHHGESGGTQKLGLKIVGHMHEMCDEATGKYGLNFSLVATPVEGLSGGFTRTDKKIYGVIPGATDRDYYTNSFHVPVYYHIVAFEKVQKEAPYREFTDGGHISYMEVDGDPTNDLETFKSIVRCMKDAGAGYGSISHPADRDPCCGYSSVIEGHVRPRCGRDEHEEKYKFEKIRRIIGYLVGTADHFNDAKASEERDRVKHEQ